MEGEGVESSFLMGFDGVISTCRNVFFIAFLHVELIGVASAGENNVFYFCFLCLFSLFIRFSKWAKKDGSFRPFLMALITGSILVQSK